MAPGDEGNFLLPLRIAVMWSYPIRGWIISSWNASLVGQQLQVIIVS